jgi:hypothetical protein
VCLDVLGSNGIASARVEERSYDRDDVELEAIFSVSVLVFETILRYSANIAKIGYEDCQMRIGTSIVRSSNAGVPSIYYCYDGIDYGSIMCFAHRFLRWLLARFNELDFATAYNKRRGQLNSFVFANNAEYSSTGNCLACSTIF